MTPFPMKSITQKPSDYYQQVRSEMLAYIPFDSRKILDVGCAEGAFGKSIKNRIASTDIDAIEVWGVETNSESAEIAKSKLDRVLTMTAEEALSSLPDAYFDCVVANDVIEHMADPGTFVENIKSKMTDQGVLVCSIPNVRYIYVLWNLIMRKQWKYEDAGVLDRTHLRFFTYKSIVDFFNVYGFKVVSMNGINGIESKKFDFLNIMTLGFF